MHEGFVLMAQLKRITDLARKIFSVPVSLVNLIGEPQLQVDTFAFHASAPLLAVGDKQIGTICIMDHKPRSFSEAEQALLLDLAGLVMDQMRLRLTSEALQAANEKLAHQATHDALTGLPNRAFFDESLD